MECFDGNARPACLLLNLVTVEILNLLDRQDHDIDYFYESRVRTGDASREQVHFHPVEPIQARFALVAKF